VAGHSKWNNIKRRKGAADAARARLFTKLAKEITVAARLGSGDPDANPRLRLAIQAAKSQSMPNDNIHRAVLKGTGELEGGSIEELVYEGYGPGGVALIVEAATDNPNRTAPDVRFIFDKHGGNLGKPGSVAFLFDKLGMLRYPGACSEESVMAAALEAGAEDIRTEGDEHVVYCQPTDFHEVKEGMEAAGLEPSVAQLVMLPQTTVVCDHELAKKTLDLVERLEDHDDVQRVHGNFEIPDDVAASLDA
jgi:YebC/PmpR family DNA-binding regulatory protein